MASFVTWSAPISRPQPPPRRCSHNTSASRCHPAAKRWHMSTNDRSKEFSLNSFPDPLNPSKSDSETIIDWDNWFSSGESMTIPAIPFPPAQVFMPGELKQLHLFEARYLALFETIVTEYDKKCAHVLIDPSRKAMAAFGTILAVKSWRRLEVGVCVDFEGIGRLKTARMKASVPFLRGDFQVVQDAPMLESEIEESRKLEQRFWSAFEEAISACVKLGEDPIRRKLDLASATIEATEGNSTSTEKPRSGTLAGENKLFAFSPDAKKELFRQKVREAIRRAVNHAHIDFGPDSVDSDMQVRRATGLSFAGWEFFPSQPGMRQKAIEEKNTLSRLATVVDNIEERSRRLVAKLALQNALSES